MKYNFRNVLINTPFIIIEWKRLDKGTNHRYISFIGNTSKSRIYNYKINVKTFLNKKSTKLFIKHEIKYKFYFLIKLKHRF